jgi:hypothetical protein
LGTLSGGFEFSQNGNVIDQPKNSSPQQGNILAAFRFVLKFLMKLTSLPSQGFLKRQDPDPQIKPATDVCRSC